MLYTVAIPAKFATEFATGSVALMNTSAGLTTSLVSSSTGTVVGWAALVPASGTVAGTGAAAGSSSGAIAATASGVTLAPILGVALGGVALVSLGVFLWRRSRKSAASDVEQMVDLIVECDEADAAAVLAQVHGIIEGAAARMAAEGVGGDRATSGRSL